MAQRIEKGLYQIDWVEEMTNFFDLKGQKEALKQAQEICKQEKKDFVEKLKEELSQETRTETTNQIIDKLSNEEKE